MVRDPLSRICRDNSHNTSESRSYDPLQKRSDVRNQDCNVYQPLILRHNDERYSPRRGTIVLRSCAVYTEDDDIDRAHISTQAPKARKHIAKGQSLPFYRTGRMINIECGASSYNSLLVPPAVAELQHPQSRPTVIQHSTACTAPGGGHSAFNLLSVTSESQSGGDSKALVDMEAPVTVEHYSVTKTLPTHSHLQTSSLDAGLRRRHTSSLPHSHSVPALSQIPSAKNKNFATAESLPDMLLKDSFEEFTPDITVDENEETYRFHCSHPGLYRCTLTGLVFHMEGEGDVVYRIVPWNHRLLAQHHKKPAGPLFDIKCLQESVCQLHLPHCEIRSTGGCDVFSVAHVNDEGIEFISPHKITETHVIINITGFSGFGNVKDEDSPPDPVRALVLLFYRPPTDPDPESVLNVLLLPKNVVLRDVLRMRKKLVGDERYIDTSPHCKLIPKQEYTLSTSPEDDSVLVQPTDAEFDEESYDNYFPSFQVNWEKNIKSIKLFLRDTNSSHSVWERRVCLLSTGVRKPCGQSTLSSPSNERLMDIRTCFIDGISGPVLKSLLDKLFEKKVITESERESADEMQNKRDKARFVIDTVRKKGEAASSEMIEFLCEVDPFLCEHLGLI
ncbi:NACHT, LRR and PYD domains-containing protein 1b allele 3-like [Scomber japonicus]|uniref:NACHT, LRR and PYD domains-containing protein 1b allele 3-like n=1 Tax=Scomber japonicus TaxID=13676 RepID=UPI0023056018|nr:NACHT, LRR and PYD domains-containing protein 1b allele 3-like [Scomber japonicus]